MACSLLTLNRRSCVVVDVVVLLHLEGRLLALEATATAAATETTTATAVTETTTAATATATTATAVTEATTATATAAEATTTTTAASATEVVAGLGGRVVQTDVAAGAVLAVELLESLLGIVNRVERDVAETLGATRLPVFVSMVCSNEDIIQ